MHLANLSFTNKYLYSPIIWIHLVKIEYKIILLLLCLIIIPFTNYIYIITSIIAYIYIFYIICIDYYFMLYMIKHFFIYLIILFFSVFLFYYNISNKQNANYTYFQILYPIKFSIKIDKIKQIIIQYNYCIIPQFISKILLFMCLNFIVLQIIFLTTKFENIILLFLSKISIIKLVSNISFQHFLFICSLASQFLEFIIQEYTNKNISIKIRKTNISETQYILYIYLIKSFIFNIIYDIKNIASILYSRELIIQDFYLINF
uniref:Uncharacterized protein n=1 Tax=Antithamnion hubbsii TaxID=1005974 RepID=A0A4D6WNP5_9FLOR|nr:hypothetical protein [Antithamnion hubbsii]